MRKLSLIIISIFLFMIHHEASSQSRKFQSFDNDPMKARIYTLPNGLTVYLTVNKDKPRVQTYIAVKAGSKFDPKETTGLAHYLEHMMFKGAKDFGKGSFDRLIEGNGGVSNAYTSNDATVYHENLPIEALEITLKMEADRMQNLLLDPQEFLAEKDVVLEERKLRYENSPNGQLFIRTMMSIYDGTPYGTPVIGSIEDVKKVSRDEVFDYFKKYMRLIMLYW